MSCDIKKEYKDLTSFVQQIISSNNDYIDYSTKNNASGIYMIYINNFSDDKILPIYIGKSNNLQKRYETHYKEILSLNHLDYDTYYEYFYNNGYNLTKGGMSKIKLDYELIVTTYQELGSIHATSKKLNIHRDSVRRALEYFDIVYDKTVSAPISIAMVDKNTGEEIKTFACIKDAAAYVGISDAMIRKYFAGKAKSAGGYLWKKI